MQPEANVESLRPVPVPDEASAPFFEGAARGELMLQRCSSLRRVHVAGEGSLRRVLLR